VDTLCGFGIMAVILLAAVLVFSRLNLSDKDKDRIFFRR